MTDRTQVTTAVWHKEDPYFAPADLPFFERFRGAGIELRTQP